MAREKQDFKLFHEALTERIDILVKRLTNRIQHIRDQGGKSSDSMIRSYQAKIFEYRFFVTENKVFIPELKETIKRLKEVQKLLVELVEKIPIVNVIYDDLEEIIKDLQSRSKEKKKK